MEKQLWRPGFLAFAMPMVGSLRMAFHSESSFRFQLRRNEADGFMSKIP